jgi:hypothetical protein
MISFDEFQAMFNALLSVAGKSDPDGILSSAYYEILKPLQPSSEEFVFACDRHLEYQRGFPTGADLKGLIRDFRQRQQPYLPASRNSDRPSPFQARENRIALLRGIYRDQGDTSFYRRMLSVKGGLWGTLLDGLPPVSHREVMESLGLPCDEEPVSLVQEPRQGEWIEEWV